MYPPRPWFIYYFVDVLCRTQDYSTYKIATSMITTRSRTLTTSIFSNVRLPYIELLMKQFTSRRGKSNQNSCLKFPRARSMAQ